MLVEATNYFSKEGLAEAVLEQRRNASAIRRELGLDPGRILVKIEGGGPDVRWECTFASRDAYEADMAARPASSAFAVTRKEMHELLDRFERHVAEVVDG